MHETMVSLDSLRTQPSAPWATTLIHDAHARHEVTAHACRLVVWGTGQCAREFVANLRSDIDLIGYIDSDPGRWGQSINGTPILRPARLAGLSFDRLVIASAYVAEIVQQLEALGLYDSTTTVAYTGVQDWWQSHDLLVVPPFFDKLQIGLTTRCNLLCQHCPRETDDSIYRDVGLPRFEEYLGGFDPLKFSQLLISDFGENTILKDFVSYLRTAKRMGWNNIEFVTNATNGKRDLWETIFGDDLAQRLIISIESATAEGFESVRGFAWTRFTANVATIADCIAKHGRRAELVFNAVCMKSNLEGLPDIVDFAARHGAQVYMVHLNPSSTFYNPMGRPENHLDYAPREDVLRVFREVKRRAAHLGVRLSLPEPFPELDVVNHASSAHVAPEPPAQSANALRCMQPFRWVEVGDNGNVYPCCQMAKRYPVGNLTTQTFEEIWSGPAYARLLDGLRPAGTPIDVCRGCNMYNGKNF